jgi:hypothetical protein
VNSANSSLGPDPSEFIALVKKYYPPVTKLIKMTPKEKTSDLSSGKLMLL